MSDLASIKKQVMRSMQKALPYIYRKWKRSTNETAGWIIDDHLLWLDPHHCGRNAVWAADELCLKLHPTGAISFHTHCYADTVGKESISVTDKLSATAYGLEVVFTFKGVYLLLPYRRFTYREARRLERALRVIAKDRSNGNEFTEEAVFRKLGHRLFKCHCYKLY